MRVRYTPRSRRDLEVIFAYIDQQNPVAARSVKRAIQHAVECLAEFPHIGTVTDRSPEFRGVRAGRYPYRVYYRIRGDEVWIVHIRDMRRQPWAGD